MDEESQAHSGQHDVGCVALTEISKPVCVTWICEIRIPSGSGSSGVLSMIPSRFAMKQSSRGFSWKALYHSSSTYRCRQANGLPQEWSRVMKLVLLQQLFWWVSSSRDICSPE